MRVTEPSPTTRVTAPRSKPLRRAVLRAVASSTAVETGQSVAVLEAKLQQPSRRFAHVTLAR